MQSSSPLTPPLPSSSLPETDQQTHHLCATRGTKRKVSGPAVTKPFVGGAKEDLTENRGSGGQSANRVDGGVMPKTPTKKRIEYVIDLCTPSPAAASKFSDPLGLNIGVIAPNVAAPSKRTPLAQVAIPNQPPLIVSALATLAEKQQELQRSNYEGYLSLCRLTKQASQRSVSGSIGGGVAGVVRRMSVSRMEVSLDTTMQDTTASSASSPPPFARSLPLAPASAIASATTAELSNERLAAETAPRETEQQKQTRLAAWKSRNARAVMACSRNASRVRAMAPGKAMTSWQVAKRGRETTTVPDTEMEVDVPKLRTADGMDESILPPPPMTNNLATRPRPVALTDNLSHTQTRYLEQFVSHQHADAYRVDPNPEHSGFRRREWSPVYACAYTHAAKRGGAGPKVLALASESGTIKLIDTNHNSSSASTTASPSTTQFYPHSNAIFDLQWDEADERILTASGDQLGAVHRLTEGGEVRREAVLFGHTSSVKTCAWYDQNTVLTAGRDGNIHIYDLRCTGAFTSDLGIDETRYNRGRTAYGAYWDQARISPVMSVRNAHGVGGGSGRKVTSRSAVRSVTSLLSLKTDRNIIASGGSADGIVKFWDLRANLASSRRIYVAEPVSQTLDRTADRGRRSRGVISLGEAGGKVYALCNDARIHPHSIQSPQLALPTYYTHSGLSEPSFYMKLSVSPCEAFLACGTSGGRFAMWNIQRDYLPVWGNRSRSSEDDVVEKGEVYEEGPVVAIQAVECGFGAGHTRQVGALDWAADQIVTCSDDYSSRIWKPDPRVGRAMRDRTNGYEYWAGTVKV